MWVDNTNYVFVVFLCVHCFVDGISLCLSLAAAAAVTQTMKFGHVVNFLWAALALLCRCNWCVQAQCTNSHSSQTISGGISNTIDVEGSNVPPSHLTACGNSIGGGQRNSVLGAGYATIAGGNGNTVVAEGGTIAGGRSNIVSGYAAFIGGGGAISDGTTGGTYVLYDGNKASGDYSGIVSGHNNTASGDYSFVAACDTCAASGYSSVAMGVGSSATHNNSAVLGFSSSGPNCSSADTGTINLCTDNGLYVDGERLDPLVQKPPPPVADRSRRVRFAPPIMAK